MVKQIWQLEVFAPILILSSQEIKRYLQFFFLLEEGEMLFKLNGRASKPFQMTDYSC